MLRREAQELDKNKITSGTQNTKALTQIDYIIMKLLLSLSLYTSNRTTREEDKKKHVACKVTHSPGDRPIITSVKPVTDL